MRKKLIARAAVDPRTSADRTPRKQEEKEHEEGNEKIKLKGYVLWLTFLLRQQRRRERRGASAAIDAAEAQEERER